MILSIKKISFSSSIITIISLVIPQSKTNCNKLIYYYFHILYKIKYILTEFNCNNSIISRIKTMTYTCINTCREEMRSYPKRTWVWLVISNSFLNLRIPIGWECHVEQTKPNGSVTKRKNGFLCSCMGLSIFT